MASYSSNVSSNGYQLIVDVTLHSQDIPSNRSRLNWVVKLKQGLYRHAALCTYDVKINGTSVWKSASGGTTIRSNDYPQNTTFTLASGTTGWISHNSDGTKSVSVSGSYKTNNQANTWSCPLLSLSGTYAITTIPRASNPTLNYSTRDLGGTIRITFGGASSSFTHTATYSLGHASATIVTKSTSSYVDWTLPNGLGSEMPTVLSKQGTITVTTYSGNTNIGSKSINFTATIPNNSIFNPTATGLTASISGNGFDKTNIGSYVQNISKVDVSFTAGTPATSGTTISSCTIKVGSTSYSVGSFGISGVISNTLLTSGNVPIVATATDARGRTATASTTINVLAYSTPKITSFTALRQTADNTKVNIVRIGSWSNLSNNNKLTIKIDWREKGGAWKTTPIENSTGNTGGSFSGTKVASNVLVTKSYDFKLTITDQFGKFAVAEISTGTSEVLFSLGKDGVGIGKIPELGRVLDISKDAFINNCPIVFFGSYEEW